MSSLFCFKSIFSSLPPDRFSWKGLPEKTQLQIVGLLEPMEKARLSMTSKYNQVLVRKVPTNIHWLQFSPIRQSKKSIRILVFFDEQQKTSYAIEFDRNGNLGCMMKVEKDGELIKTKILKRGYQEMADKCFEGWMKGTSIHTLDVRGTFSGKVPDFVKVVTFSVADKYRHEHSAIPDWLLSVPTENLNLLLMSDHWPRILRQSQFSNPSNTCKLTGYDEIEHCKLMESLSCRQIHLNNVKDEKTFNAIAKKWSSGSLPDSFDWLIVTTLSSALKTENLLRDLKVQSLEKSIFSDFDEFSSDLEYFLVFSGTEKLAVFCAMKTFARLLAVSSAVLEQLPELRSQIHRINV